MFLLVGRITSLAKEKRESLLASTSTSTGGGGGGIPEDKLDDFMRQVDELRIELEREKERMDAFLIGACFSCPLRRCPFGNRATHSPTAWHSQNDRTLNRTGISTRCFASRRSSTSTCSSNSRRLRTRSCSSCARCSAWCVYDFGSVRLRLWYPATLSVCFFEDYLLTPFLGRGTRNSCALALFLSLSFHASSDRGDCQ